MVPISRGRVAIDRDGKLGDTENERRGIRRRPADFTMTMKVGLAVRVR